MNQCSIALGTQDLGTQALGTQDEVETEALEALAWRSALARRFASSKVVRLRHASPVGHFFAVPSLNEIEETWAESWRTLVGLGRNSSTPNPLRVLQGSNPELNPIKIDQGLPLLISACAGLTTPLEPTRMLSALSGAIRLAIN